MSYGDQAFSISLKFIRKGQREKADYWMAKELTQIQANTYCSGNEWIWLDLYAILNESTIDTKECLNKKD